jgi:hypothetical protein
MTTQMARPKRQRRSIPDLASRALVIVCALGVVWVASQAVGMGLRNNAAQPFVIGLLMLAMAYAMVKFGLRDD